MYPTRTSPVACGLAGLGEGEQRRRVTGEREVSGGADGGGRAAGGGVQTALDGWEWMSVGVWIEGLVIGIVGRL